jgi:3-isopropylmalate/(R)-2-methylmalate dehydratase small subunit
MGRVHKYGEHVNTDVLYPGRHLANPEPEYQRAHALEDLDPDFAATVKAGDVVVAGRNFGCGSSREQAVTCLKYAGVSAVVAKSFARIYYRNCVNNGVAPLVCADAVDGTEAGDELTVDLAAGTIHNQSRGATFRFEPLPEFLREMLDAGGLIPYLRAQRLGQAAQ